MSLIWFDEMKLSQWAKWYCLYVEDDEKVRRMITIPMHICLYCKEDNYMLLERCVVSRSECEWLTNDQLSGLKDVLTLDF